LRRKRSRQEGYRKGGNFARPEKLKVDRRLARLANRLKRIPRAFFFRNPFLFVRDDFEQPLPVLCGGHGLHKMLLVVFVAQHLARLGVEFLAGKQLPYIGVALIQFATLVVLAILLFRVPLKGSWETLVFGGVIYVLASTGFGLLISVFAPTQTAAIFAAAIITILPAVQFSGMFVPVSSLTGGAWFAARIFPSTYFQAISVGTFTKALGLPALWRNVAALGVLALVYFVTSVALLEKQED